MNSCWEEKDPFWDFITGYFATWHRGVSVEDVSCVVGLNILIQSFTQLLMSLILLGGKDTE